MNEERLNNRQLLVFNVEYDQESDEYSLHGERPLSDELRAPSLVETQEKLCQGGWKSIGHCKIYNGRLVQVWEQTAAGERIAVWELIRWMMWVDLEGFSHLYSEDAGGRVLWGVRCLMDDLHRIGNDIYGGEDHRLFMHQVGDGFIIKPDFGDIDLLRPLAIGTALLRASLLRGYCLKIGIGLGGLADVQGCYPKEIMDKSDDSCIPMGAGLMTVFPVMGDGLIDAHAVAEKASGPLLIARKDLADAVPADGFPRIEYHSHFEVDWIHAESPEISSIINFLSESTEPDALKRQLRDYLNQHHAMGDEWRKSAELLIRGYRETQNA